MAVPCVGSVTACPVWLPCSVPQTARTSQRPLTLHSSHLRLHPVKQQWWGGVLRCHHTEPFTSCVLCYDTALKAHEERREACKHLSDS
ncbi:hypothetical protein PAMP_018952 [Pampus punctatissimus]